MTEQSIRFEINNDALIEAINDLKNLIATKAVTQGMNQLVFTTRELADQLKTHEARVGMWRQCGAIKGIKKGKEYIFSRSEVERFLEDYAGYDLSNEFKVKFAVHEVFLRNNKKESSTSKSVNSLRI